MHARELEKLVCDDWNIVYHDTKFYILEKGDERKVYNAETDTVIASYNTKK